MAKKTNKFLNYFKEVKTEMKKVVWPSFKQVKNNTLVVIACVLVIGAFIWVLDLGFTSVWKVVNPAEEVVEETTGTEEVPEVSPEQQAAYMEQMIAQLEEIGVRFDTETGKAFDIETGAELTDEEVTAKMQEAGLIAEGTEVDANAETTEGTPAE